MQKLFFNIIKHAGEKEYFEYYLAYLISPIITGIKPSSIININNNSKNLLNSWNTYRDIFLSSLNLEYMIIKRESNKETVLIYNRSNLASVLKCSRIQNFLKDYGYNNLNDIDLTLSHLNTRFESEDCPHEIGIFLGIPIHDVEGFINCKGEPCLLCGYWKVYSNEDYAKKLFRQYDLSKEIVTNCILQNKNLTHICSTPLLSLAI